MKSETTGIGRPMTAERATEKGYFAMSVEAVLIAEKVDLSRLKEGERYFESYLHFDIVGVPECCPNCDAEIDREWEYCPFCGEEVAVRESYKTMEEAKKSKNAHIGIKDMVSFWARVREPKTAELELHA